MAVMAVMAVMEAGFEIGSYDGHDDQLFSPALMNIY